MPNFRNEFSIEGSMNRERTDAAAGLACPQNLLSAWLSVSCDPAFHGGPGLHPSWSPPPACPLHCDLTPLDPKLSLEILRSDVVGCRMEKQSCHTLSTTTRRNATVRSKSFWSECCAQDARLLSPSSQPCGRAEESDMQGSGPG